MEINVAFEKWWKSLNSFYRGFYGNNKGRVKAAYEAGQASRDTPCVWEETLGHEGQTEWRCGCGSRDTFLEFLPAFCPACGHPVEVKDDV